jgi:hypothetical protein
MRVPQRPDGKGSLRWVQHLVANPSFIDAELRAALGLNASVTIEWLSPVRPDDYSEYRDGTFLARLGLERCQRQLAEFWPRRGPQWDALARTSDGKVLLVEAKAHVRELASDCAASPSSRSQIDQGLDAAKRAFGVRPDADWSRGYYQYANRLAHLYFLRERCGVDAHLVFLYFLNARDTARPASRAEWEHGIAAAHRALELPADHSPEGVHDLFVDVDEIAALASTREADLQA